jgi:hypothetical protein
MTRRSNKEPPQGAFKDIRPLEDDATLDKVVDTLNTFINSYNFLTKSFSFEKNINGFFTQVTIPANSEISIQHFLGVKPKYRLILRQEGNGIISDVSSGWDDKVITLFNNGAVQITATILIVRE